jgi:hypothetical protein
MNNIIAASSKTQPAAFNWTRIVTVVTVLVFLFAFSFVLSSVYWRVGVDWHQTFFHASRVPIHPFQIESFMNPPWVMLIMAPLGLFPEHVGFSINAGLSVMVFGWLIISRKGGFLPFILTLTSAPFYYGAGVGNIEWLIALGFVLQNRWSMLYVLIKPQSGIFGALDWFLKSKNKLAFLIPSAIVIADSFLIWGWWPRDLVANYLAVEARGMGWNDAPFPYLVPIGISLLVYVIKRRPANSELLGVLASLCLSPYFAYYSLAVAFALFSLRYKRLAILVWLVLWAMPLIQMR